MTDAQTTLLLTRPADRSEAFLSACEVRLGRRVPVVISPLIEIVEVGSVPDLSPYATVIVTSRSAVQRLGEAGLLRGRAVATVGEATAEHARSFGAQAEALGHDVDAFLGKADGLVPPCLHCRGVHSVGDLAARLSAAGCETDEAVIYDQAPRPLSPPARGLLAATGPVVAPIFSPRSATLLQKALPIKADLRVIAMSPAVADAWTGPGRVTVAREPTFAAMVEATIAEI